MHEMAIAQNLLEIAESEIRARNCSKILFVRVEYGVLAGIMPEALRMGFEILIRDTPHKDAVLELVCLPGRLRCPFCGATFEAFEKSDIWQPCPKCGEAFGHIVEQGKELILAHLEAC